MYHRLSIRCLLCAVFVFAAVRLLVAQESTWVDLFDGKSLDGWTQRGGAAVYEVNNGEIIGSTVPNTPNSFLCTEQHFSDFELELEFFVHPELNSGIQIRSNSLPDYQAGRVHGYQVEIDPSDRAWTAGIYDESRRGWLYDLSANTEARYAFKQGAWNHLRIKALGPRIQTWLNGVAAADLIDDMTAEGFIGLQVHGVGGRSDKLTVKWRNLRLREITKGDRGDVSDEKSPADTSIDVKPASTQIFVDDVKIQKLASGFRFVEGPAVGPDGAIYFSDIPNNAIHRFDRVHKTTTLFRENTGGANGLYWTANDALLCCEGTNRRVTRIWQDNLQVLVDQFENAKLNSPNDLTLDNSGGFYFTDPRYGNRDTMEMQVEGVYYVDAARKISRVIDDLKQPNGIILSPDGKTLYVADFADAKTWAYTVVGNGSLQDKRLFCSIGSDGMSIDRAGNVYLTWRDAIYVFSSNGAQLAELTLPEPPANCTLVGSTLYITARTSLYAAETLQQGIFE
ncbi:MAG TPA: DUF1080 domain-containing protein [Pirellulaceae bacterium]|nr:DUF1080 domain-containing protein [Pirellulaceae bacterium]HMO93045.1 DUF1080 domain-containing protein [Pirellulaceae bacterium]HMP69675.1 DUF1080 domain-containing protein [Pirellulaceae bacterium]